MYKQLKRKIKIGNKKKDLLQEGKGPKDGGRKGEMKGREVKRMKLCYTPVPVPHKEGDPRILQMCIRKNKKLKKEFLHI